MVVRLSLTALDCPDPMALAAFYSALTGWPLDATAEELDALERVSWLQLRSDGGPTLAFQRVEGYLPPQWPDGPVPQQLHLDFDVDDLDEAEAQVLALGARRAQVQPGDPDFRVYLDPAGHPFCLVRAD
jgi:catechol 2,3-dioxygenase-like lactoylglutathione lyase family enzyme